MSEENTKERILLTAGPMFAELGFQGVTVRDICDRAGVNLASVNYYFGDKDSLYLEAVRSARQAQHSQFPSFVPDLSAPPENLLRNFVRILLNRLGVAGPTTWQVQLLVREFMQPGEACRQIVESYFRPYFEILLRIVDGLAGQRLSEEQRLKIGFSIIGQCLHYRLAQPIISMFVNQEEFERDFQLDSLVDHIVGFSIAGVRGLGQSQTSSKPIEIG